MVDWEGTIVVLKFGVENAKEGISILGNFQIRSLIAQQYRNVEPFEALDQMLGDSWFDCPTEALAESLSRNGNKVFRSE